MASPLRALMRLLALAGLTLGLGLVQWPALKLNLPLSRRIPPIYHRRAARLVGLRPVVRGEMCRRGPVLFVSNHCSYLDIMVLGSIIPGSFVAKSEVAGWPVVGLLCRMHRTVFVDRQARSVARQCAQMTERLRQGDNLILFPEGTSSDGNRTLPFKSALFAVAQTRIDDQPLTVQPVSIAYTHLDGMPMGRNLRPFYAWYGDMDFAPHFWKVLGMGRATVTVQFHPPVTIDDFGSRKALARHCESVVAAGVADALSGRRPDRATARAAA